MGYLDYTLQKLNAINQMNELRYREKRLEEETKSQFINSLAGLVPQAISGAADAAKKQAAIQIQAQKDIASANLAADEKYKYEALKTNAETDRRFPL